MQTSRQHRYKEAFLKARDQELDWQLEDALLAYEAIDKEFAKDYDKDDKEGFEGVRVRILQVKNTIAEAKDAHEKGQKAEKAGKLKEAADHYSEAVAVYPGYQGLEAKIASLRSKLK